MVIRSKRQRRLNPPTGAPARRGTPSDAADPPPVPTPRATETNAPATRPTGARSCPTLTRPAGPAAPASRAGSPHPPGARGWPRPGPWPVAGLTMRPQPPSPQRPGQRRVRAGIPELDQLVMQGASPQMRILHQPQPRVPGKRIPTRRAPHTRDSLTRQIPVHRAPIQLQMTSNRADRPPTRLQCLCLHHRLPCQHSGRPPKP